MEVFHKAIEENLADLSKNPMTKIPEAVARTQEITLLVIQMIASAMPQENCREKLESGLKEKLSFANNNTEKYQVESIEGRIRTYVDEKLKRVKDLITSIDENLCTRIHGVFQAHTDMSLSQFTERWRKYRTGHELRVSI